MKKIKVSPITKKYTGNNIRELRESRGLSIVQLSDILDIDENTLGNYERGRHMVSLDILIKLADYFNVATDYILRVE